MKPVQSLTLGARLTAMETGQSTATEYLEACLSRIAEDDDGSVHTALFQDSARAEATAADRLRKAGGNAGTLGGLPLAIKALFDVKGQVTHSGSKLLAGAPPATRDAVIVERLRRAGASLTGHTNMTEFAYSGLGLNPHYGTPGNPFDIERIPGGSSSGCGVAAATGMAAAAIGTDTGGSVRIPAAFCGLVGFKPTQRRVPRDGAFALSSSLDSIGSLAPTVDCCARLDAVLAGEVYSPLAPPPVRGLRFAVPQHYMLDGMDTVVAQAFDRALKGLRDAGAVIEEISARELLDLTELMEGGGLTAAESYHIHRRWLDERPEDYDPRVSTRMLRGAKISAADYLELCRRREEQIARADRLLTDFDALLSPTVPIVPPRLDELQDDDHYGRQNLLVLRNPTVANLLDLCALTVPMQMPGELPVGLMLMGRGGHDQRLLRHGMAVEQLIA